MSLKLTQKYSIKSNENVLVISIIYTAPTIKNNFNNFNIDQVSYTGIEPLSSHCINGCIKTQNHCFEYSFKKLTNV